MKSLLHLLACISALVLLAMPRSAAAQAQSAVPNVVYPEPIGYAGVPVVMQIEVTGADEIEPPKVPEIPGTKVEVRPAGRFTSISIVNGRRSQTVRSTFEIIFLRDTPGTLEIPKIQITVGSQTYESHPMKVELQKSDAGDLLKVYITGEPANPYVGERVEASLQIWIKKLTAARSFDRESYFEHIINGQESEWGVFKSAIEQYSHERRFRVAPHVETTDDGVEYDVFEFRKVLVPDRVGPLDVGAVVIKISYPRNNGVRPAISGITANKVEVKELPTAGRPAGFAGAVGLFEIQTSALPLTVAAGDPVTLTVKIVDRSREGTDLSRLQPPSLADLPALTQSFRVPNEPLAGTVNGRMKVFTQTIRPINDKVTDIPPIPFSYFDPLEQGYHTVQSKPIPINVTPAERLNPAAIIGATGVAPPPTPDSKLTDVEQGLLANRAVTPAMLASERLQLGWGAAAVAVVPPLAAAMILVMRRRADRFAGDERLARSSSAKRNATRALARAADPASVAGAVVGYLANRSGRPAASLTRREALLLLEEHGGDQELQKGLDSLLLACERSAFASGGPAPPLDELRRRARDLLGRLDFISLRGPEVRS